MSNFSRWPPLNCLRGFEAAARLESFSKAAEELHMTQSAVSHQIKTLESYLGQPLFLRVNRKVLLSDAGLDLLATAEECLNLLGDGFKRLEQYKKPNQIIVHTSTSFATNWLVPRLHGFYERHPSNDIWLYTTDHEPDLDLSEVHVAILHGSGRWPGLSITRLLEDILVPVCAPDFALMDLKNRTPVQLMDYPLLHGEQRETWQTWFSHQNLAELNPISGPNFSNPSLMLQSARLGEGVALASLVLAADDLESGALVTPFPRGFRSRYSYFRAVKHEGLQSPNLEPFLQWLENTFEVFQQKTYSRLAKMLL